ncbi:S8 family serine peptidase [Anaerobaca lacustris]|uniref:S8 family serine peptidase n=1 Tax=Anaerobaca lacustris TaxID=3044600 RepID=A0AAW6TUK3_9BACT|nr:S8 family serine peptidase [Sedimentisphaerales bacterium M17dextr]
METLRRALGIALAILLGCCQVPIASAQSESAGRKVLIGFNRLVESQRPQTLAELIQRAGGKIEHSYHLLPVVLATLNDETIENLRDHPEIAYVERDQRVHATVQETPWNIERIDAERVWHAEYGASSGAGVNVAILDTGIDADHPDLAVAGGVNFTGNLLKDGSTRRADWIDKEGHGTHCAGVVAALDNSIGVVGVSPRVRLWAVRVLADDRSGYVSDVIQGIEWCVDNGIDIASMSFAGQYSQALREACDIAYRAGLLLVAASGNDGSAVGYPAAYDSVIAVSAIDTMDGLAGFSCVGPEVELAAPGVGVRSTYRDGGYASFSGTSMACPHVVGVAALVWASPALGVHSAAAVRARLQETAERLPSLSSEQVGYGLVHAGRAAVPPAVTDLAVAGIDVPGSVVQGDSVEVIVTVENVGNRACAAGVSVTLATGSGSSANGVIGARTTAGPLSPGASAMLTYTWDTTDVPSGAHTLMARHDLSDDDATNDARSVPVVVHAAITDIAITGVDGPSVVTKGDSVQIVVTVENVGDRDVEEDIAVSLTLNGGAASHTGDDIVIGMQIVRGGLRVGQDAALTYTWDTRGVEAGVHALTARHDRADEYSDNDSDGMTLTVAAGMPSAGVTITSIMPKTMWSGMSGSVIIRGTGFVDGAEVSFEGGEGLPPVATGIRVMGSSSIMARVAVGDRTLPAPSVWDVRVTNPDGSSAVFHDGLIVQP